MIEGPFWEAVASLYFIGFSVTFGAFISSNRVTGTPYRHALIASVFWPIWWMVAGMGGFK